jgi:hypothetical protein
MTLRASVRAIATALMVAAIACAASHAEATTYYVDSLAGADGADGAGPERAWRTLDRVNAQPLEPGDAVLFRAGCEWTGQLRPQGSGAVGRPIRLDCYGEGPLPVLDAAGAPGAVVALTDQDWWEIRRLELRGGAPRGARADRQGVLVEGVDTDRTLRHIHIEGCRIVGIEGTLEYRSSAIWVAIPLWYQPIASRSLALADIRIAGNEIREVSRSGIIVLSQAVPVPDASAGGDGPGGRWTTPAGEALPASTEVVVTGNTLEGIAGDAIMVIGVEKPLVERNTVRRCCLRAGADEIPAAEQGNPCAAGVWLQCCTGGVLQHNDVADTAQQPGNRDAQAYDLDYACYDCTIQYNVSRDNAGGFLLMMPTVWSADVRYNLSQNDGGGLLTLGTGAGQNNLLSHNVFYQDRGRVSVYPNARIEDSIFVARREGRFHLASAPQPGTFAGNCYDGPWEGDLPPDARGIVAGSRLVAPGTGGSGPDSWEGYRLQPDSPCVDAGGDAARAGVRDFWGSPLADGRPDVGAHEVAAAEHR